MSESREIILVERGRLLSLKRRVAAAESLELAQLVKEVADIGAPLPEELILAFTERLERGVYISTEGVAALIGVSRSRRLYQAARDHLLKDTWALITLLRADIPDSAIENRLRDELYQIFRDSDNPRRSEILVALAEHGSTGCLDDLEAIRYEFTPKLQTAELAREVEQRSDHAVSPCDLADLLKVATRLSDIEFGERVRSAANRIRERGKPPSKEWDVWPPNADTFGLSHTYIQRAEQHVAAKDYGAALNYCRKALEAALKIFIKIRKLNVKKEGPIDKLLLPALMAIVNSQVDLPKDIRVYMEDVRDDSTYGSHDQGIAPDAVLTAGIAQATVDKYRQVEAYLAKAIAGSA